MNCYRSRSTDPHNADKDIREYLDKLSDRHIKNESMNKIE